MRNPMSNPAETYESYMVPTLFAPWASRLIEAAGPQDGQRILDLGCGTGIVARRLAQRFNGQAAIAGLDLSPNMLAVAQAAAEKEDLAITWHEGRAEQLPFADASFDLVVCQFTLMFLADRALALSEAHRVLAPGGRIALSVFQGLDRHPFYQALDQAIHKRLGASCVQDIFALGDAQGLHRLVSGSGFEDVKIEARSMTCRFPNPQAFLAGEIDVDTAAIPSMQALDAEARARLVAAISEDMAQPLHDVIEDDHVVLTFHANLVTGVRQQA
jgi:ubiquinone/menaquinone biosynthesis C-methylase UbiE